MSVNVKIVGIFLKIGVSLTSLIIAVLLTEGLLRIFNQKKGLSAPWVVTMQSNLTLDPNTIFISQRVKELLVLPPDENIKTIVALGDSFTQGVPVEEENNFPSVLAKLVHQSSQNYKMVNLGIVGYGADQSFRLFQEYLALGHKPAIVLWSFYDNDIYENYSQPIYDIVDSRLILLDAKANWIYRRQLFFDNIPLPQSIKMQSYLVNQMLFIFERWIGTEVPTGYQSQKKEWAAIKIQKELDEMGRMANQYDFLFIPVLITPQAAYLKESERQTKANWTMLDYAMLRKALGGNPSFFPVVFSSSTTAPSDVLGASSNIADEYFADDSQDPSPLGTRHFNEKGYALYATLLYKHLLEIDAFKN